MLDHLSDRYYRRVEKMQQIEHHIGIEHQAPRRVKHTQGLKNVS